MHALNTPLVFVCVWLAPSLSTGLEQAVLLMALSCSVSISTARPLHGLTRLLGELTELVEAEYIMLSL